MLPRALILIKPVIFKSGPGLQSDDLEPNDRSFRKPPNIRVIQRQKGYIGPQPRNVRFVPKADILASAGIVVLRAVVVELLSRKSKTPTASGLASIALNLTDRSVNAATMKSKPRRASSRRPAGLAGRTTARAGARFAKAVARRDAILDAALDEFSVRGFEATRLDDVAKRAGVAKGTIYLHFNDKESLFQELIRSKMAPVVGTLEATFAADLPLRMAVDKAIDVFVREVYGSHRKQLIRLIISEGPRFPALAEFYYREVLSRILKSVRGLLRRALERGELADDTLIRFPQLLGAPGIIAIIWSGLFDRFEPLDVRAMMRAHFRPLLDVRKQP
jgi:AcrR family transcriptional regulator